MAARSFVVSENKNQFQSRAAKLVALALLPPEVNISEGSDVSDTEKDETQLLQPPNHHSAEFSEDDATPSLQEELEDAFISVNTDHLPSAVQDQAEEVQASGKRKGARKSQPKRIYSWTSGDFCHAVGTEESVPVNNFTIPVNVQTPVHYFLSFFSDDLITTIVENTNLYSTQVTGKSVNTTHNEIKDFLAILLRMGIVDMPAYTDYWSAAMTFEHVSSVMPLKRFQALRRYLHFANNEEMNDDSFYKVRPVLEIVRQNCIRLECEKRHSIDEMMIPYKGTKAGSRRQYVKNKPKKWGYKMFVRSGVSGIVYDFLMYGGEDTFRGYSFTTEEEQLGMSGKVVVALCKSIRNPQCQIVYFDNFFCSLELNLWLRDEYGIFSLGTLRANRLRGCPLKADKQLAKSGRGSYDQKVEDDKKIAIIKWYDNRAVVLASSYVASEPVTTIKRYSKAEKKRVDVCCPEIVKHYNTHMGGVDLSDMLVALYRTGMKTRRWYMGIFSQILDICVNNAWLLYRRECTLKNTPSELTLKQFRLRVADGLQLHGKLRRGRPSSQELGEQQPKKNP